MSGPRFSIIPAWIVTDSRLKGSDLKVLCLLGSYTNKEGWCRRSQVKMADQLSCARSTVQASLDRLFEIGVVEKREEASADGRDSAHWYRVILDRQVSSDAFHAWEGDDEEENAPMYRASEGHPPAGTPAPPADSGSAPPADSGPAPINDSSLNPSSNDGERAREREDDRKSIERDFKRWYPTWPTYVSDSEPAARKAWFDLAADERRQAAERTAAYFEAVKASGRTKICSAGVYLSEKRWEKLPEPRAEAVAPVLHKPFGKAWNALRLAELLAPIAHLPPMTATNRMLVERGGPLGEQVRREHRERYGWPKVSRMHERAARAEGVTIGPQYVVISEDFELVHVDSAKAEAWRALHAARGWPWLPEMGKHPWLYFPAADGDSEADVAAALARFEGLIREVRGDEHAA